MAVADARYVFTNADSPNAIVGTLRKRAADDLWFEFDVGNVAEVRMGEAIAFVSVSVVPPAELTIGTPIIDEFRVGIQVADGTVGTAYLITCTATTSGGAVIARTGEMVVS